MSTITAINIHSLLPPPSFPQWACKWHGTLEAHEVFISLYDVRCGRCGNVAISSDREVTTEIRFGAAWCEQTTRERWRLGAEREKKSTAPRGL